MQHRTFQPISPTLSAQRLSLAVAWVLLLLVVQLGVLNPVGCLIHCLPHTQPVHRVTAPFAFFCLVPEQYQPIANESSSTSMAGISASGAPQAAYAFVLVALTLVTLIAGERTCIIRDRFILTHHDEPPLVPPPQAL